MNAKNLFAVTTKNLKMASMRNRQPILQVCQQRFQKTSGKFLSIAEGDGHHIDLFAQNFPNLRFYPTEFDQDRIATANKNLEKYSNVEKCVYLDASKPATWGYKPETFDYILNVNMIHISPWEATLGLFTGCGEILKPDGLLVTYGPYMIDGVLEPESNQKFDQNLKSRDSSWGIRDTADLEKLAAANSLILEEKVAMPSNNFCLIFRKK